MNEIVEPTSIESLFESFSKAEGCFWNCKCQCSNGNEVE